MNHDVFISYSSRNKPTALALCHVLEEHRIKCWMAPRDIPAGADYGDVIDEAIVACRLFVLVFSEPASISQWVKGELNLAFSEKKIIIPYRIDETPLKGAMRLILNQTHWVDAYPDAESKFGELVEAAERFLGRPAGGASRTEPVVPLSVPAPMRRYKVGDYYNENGKEGVVFEVDKTGLHGKIVGLKHGDSIKWCSTTEYRKNVLTGATDRSDGMRNQRLIEHLAGWRENYPAFAWCAEQGKGWYLPAIGELETLVVNNAINKAVNRTLVRHGGNGLFDREERYDYSYWSSSSEYEESAWMATIGRDMADTHADVKAFPCYVRAVSAF